jgi:hypothetical protein
MALRLWVVVAWGGGSTNRPKACEEWGGERRGEVGSGER